MYRTSAKIIQFTESNTRLETVLVTAAEADSVTTVLPGSK